MHYVAKLCDLLIDMWNVISEAGKAEVKQESIEAKGHNSDYRTKGERERETMSYRPCPGPGPGTTTMTM